MDPGRRGLVVLAILAVLAALAGAWFFAASGSTSHAPASASPGSAEASDVAASPNPQPANEFDMYLPGGPSLSSSPSELVVDVVGRVAHPGLVRVAAGARIYDVLQAAGGVLPGTDLSSLNLASKVSDGAQIFVGVPIPTRSLGGVVADQPTSPVGAGEAPDGVIDLNTATAEQLEALPGVGPVLARTIVNWRASHGHFTSVSQLQQIPGIGPAKYAQIRERVRV